MIKEVKMCCDIICKWHETPLNLALHVLGFILLLYGFWIHSFSVIISAVIIMIIGHVVQTLIKSTKAKRKR